MTDLAAAPCCDLHNQHCEPPADLCCARCTEVSHPDHRSSTETCVLALVSGPGDHHARPSTHHQQGDTVADTAELCGKRCGPVWKLDGETCVCVERAGHVEREDGTAGADHVCSCGAWFVDEVARD